MSRYELLSRPGKAVKVIVGWDPPLMTFFATVDKGQNGRGRILWLGSTEKECQDLDTLRQAIGEWADLPEGIAENLDRDRENSQPPSPLQQAGLAFAAALRRTAS